MRRSTLFWGTMLVIFGLVMLLDNLGLLGNLNLWQLMWPGFLILLGVWVLFGTLSRSSGKTEHVSIPLGGANKARVRLQHGAGRLDVSAGASAGNLLEADVAGGVEMKTKMEADRLVAKLRVPENSFPFSWLPGDTLDWSVRLATGVPLVLEVKCGANATHLNLRDLQVSDLRFKSGASATDIDLPENAGFTRVEADAGAASLTFRVPAHVAAQIRYKGGLSAINLNESRFPRAGEFYQSADYEAAANRVEINVKMDVGSVTIL